MKRIQLPQEVQALLSLSADSFRVQFKFQLASNDRTQILVLINKSDVTAFEVGLRW